MKTELGIVKRSYSHLDRHLVLHNGLVIDMIAYKSVRYYYDIDESEGATITKIELIEGNGWGREIMESSDIKTVNKYLTKYHDNYVYLLSEYTEHRGAR